MVINMWFAYMSDLIGQNTIKMPKYLRISRFLTDLQETHRLWEIEYSHALLSRSMTREASLKARE